MTLFTIAALELLVMWIVWLYPFLRKRFTGPKREANVMAPRADWGLLLESAGIFLCWYWAPNTSLPPPLACIIASMILAPAATVFGILAAKHLGKQLRIRAGLYADHELVRTGPYAIVRHPVYTSLFFLMLSTGLLHSTWWVILISAVLYIIGTEIRIYSEEGLLRSRFGEQFEQYRRHVPAYLPFVR